MNQDSGQRVGIIGLGNIGHHHVKQLQKLDATVAGGMDIQAAARTRFRETFGIPTYEDHEALFEKVDAVIVTTPNRFHEEYAIAALEAGVPVLIEKPLAHTLESAERIATAAADSETFCMAGFNNRFNNPVEVLVDQRDEGRFGDTYHVEANYVRRRGIPGRGSWFTSRDVAGGGALIDIGVHAIDLSLYMLDFPEVVEVNGETRSKFGTDEDYSYLTMWGEDTGAENFDVDDSASAFIRCADGSTVSLEVAWASNRPPSQEYYLHGTEAGAHYDMETNDLTVYESSTEGKHHFTDAEIETRPSESHMDEQACFLAAVKTGELTRNRIEDGLTVQRVVDAIYRSSETGEAISLDE